MVRPNGSVIGLNSDAGEDSEVSVIHTPCDCGGGHDGHGATFRNCNLCMMRPAHNPQLVGCSARNQRLGGGGKGDPAAGGASAAPWGGLGCFGFFRAALGGGAAGGSSATTGLGSTVVEAGVVKSPGMRTICTGTVTGWNLFIVKVIEKPPSGAGTVSEQGVLQLGPTEVRASAPDGTDSS